MIQYPSKVKRISGSIPEVKESALNKEWGNIFAYWKESEQGEV